MGEAEGDGGLSVDAGGHPARAAAARSVVGRLARDKSGATAIEYALVASMISIVIVVALQLMGPQLVRLFNAIWF